MGNHFKTDIDQLATFSKGLRSAGESLDQVRTAMQQVRGAEIGTSELDEVCDEFQDCWKYGSEQIKVRVDKLTEGLKKNTESYREVEKSLEESFKRAAAEGR